MHYPVHFHMARKTPQPVNPTDPPVTFIEDSSVWDSMTRWMVLHASQGVTLARNVGYLSIGHGYYLEDATETDNKLYSNIGIFARAAVINPQNPRQVPGILAAPYPDTDPDKKPVIPQEQVPYHTRHRSSHGVLDDQRLERFRVQHGSRRGDLRRLLLVCPCSQQHHVALRKMVVVRFRAAVGNEPD